MIKEIYVDNFRCLVNFRISLETFQLWLGDNGSGKSSTLEALRSIQKTLNGDHVEDIFPLSSLTAWEKRTEQLFALEVEIGGERYHYELLIEHSMHERRCRIKKETLKWNGKVFFLFDNGDAHLYRVNSHSGNVEEGVKFSANWSRSVISTIAEREDNQALIRFREEVSKWLIIQPVPLVVKQIAESESRNLTRHAENFAQWYRHLLQESPGIAHKAGKLLLEVLPGFDELRLSTSGDSRKLKAVFRIDEEDRPFEFNDLSDGQRQLIILYTILESLRNGTFTVLLVDEPDNFVSIREIQPWLDELREACEMESRQSIIISHHPEVVNKMAHGEEVFFSRLRGAHVVVKPYPTVTGLTPAETMARGWDSE